MTLAQLKLLLPAAARAWLERHGDLDAAFTVFNGGASADARTADGRLHHWWPAHGWQGPS